MLKRKRDFKKGDVVTVRESGRLVRGTILRKGADRQGVIEYELSSLEDGRVFTAPFYAISESKRRHAFDSHRVATAGVLFAGISAFAALGIWLYPFASETKAHATPPLPTTSVSQLLTTTSTTGGGGEQTAVVYNLSKGPFYVANTTAADTGWKRAISLRTPTSTARSKQFLWFSACFCEAQQSWGPILLQASIVAAPKGYIGVYLAYGPEHGKETVGRRLLIRYADGFTIRWNFDGAHFYDTKGYEKDPVSLTTLRLEPSRSESHLATWLIGSRNAIGGNLFVQFTAEAVPS